MQELESGSSMFYKEYPSQYTRIHRWVYRNFGKATYCQQCGTTERKYHWSNKSGKYLKEISDWQQLCASCHSKYDFTEEKRQNLIKYGRNNRKLPVLQLDRNNNVVNRYSSIKEAEEITGISDTCICSNLKGRQHSAGGYIWKYLT